MMFAHLATVLPAVLLGLIQFIMKKGTKLHRGIGWAYMICMMITAILTLFMEARVGGTFLNHFGCAQTKNDFALCRRHSHCGCVHLNARKVFTPCVFQLIPFRDKIPKGVNELVLHTFLL
jgi:hypothetical protein